MASQYMGASKHHLEHLAKIPSPSAHAHFLSTSEEAKKTDFGVSHTWADSPLSAACLWSGASHIFTLCLHLPIFKLV